MGRVFFTGFLTDLQSFSFAYRKIKSCQFRRGLASWSRQPNFNPTKTMTASPSTTVILALPALFPLGRMFATPGAIGAFDIDDLHACLLRHVCGDFGDVCDDDKAANHDALIEINGEPSGRIVSAYDMPEGGRLLIITEQDRSATTMMLPSEY